MQHRLTQANDDFFVGEVVLLEVFFHEGVISLGRRLHHCMPLLQSQLHQISGDGFPFVVRSQPTLHCQKVNHTLEMGAFAKGNLQIHKIPIQIFFDTGHGAVDAHIVAVHFVDEQYAGDVAFGRGLPHNFGSYLHARHRIDQDQRPFANAQGTVHFANKIHVAGGVEQVDFDPVALEIGEGGGDGAFAGDFFFLKIHHGRATAHTTHAGCYPSLEQQPLDEGCFPCAVMGHNGNITDFAGFVLFHGDLIC